MLQEIVILFGVWMVIGIFGGSFVVILFSQFVVIVICVVIECVGIEVWQIGMVVFGYVLNIELCDMYLLWVVMFEVGVFDIIFVMNVNWFCGLGVQVIVLVMQVLMLGDVDFVVVGGVEFMSCVFYVVFLVCFGVKMGDVQMLDMMIGVLICLMGIGYMGVIVENVV